MHATPYQGDPGQNACSQIAHYEPQWTPEPPHSEISPFRRTPLSTPVLGKSQLSTFRPSSSGIDTDNSTFYGAQESAESQPNMSEDESQRDPCLAPLAQRESDSGEKKDGATSTVLILDPAKDDEHGHRNAPSDGDDSCKKRTKFLDNLPVTGILMAAYKKWCRKDEKNFYQPAVAVSLSAPPPYKQLAVHNRKTLTISQYEQASAWKHQENPMEDNCCGLMSLLCHGIAITSLGMIVWRIPQGLLDPLLICAAVLGSIFYIIIILESAYCYALRYIKKYFSFKEVSNYISLLRHCPPYITLSAKYRPHRFHKHLPMPKNLNKDGQVVVHLPLVRCVDASGEIKGCHPGKSSRVELNKVMGFVNEENAREYKRMKKAFLQRYRCHPDEEVHVDIGLTGYTDRLMVYFDIDGTPRVFRPYCFWLFTVLLGGWPFRWWMRLRTEKVHYTLLKLLELDNNMDWLPREPTLDDNYVR